ncbi:MAG TPA: lipid-A-disaccharide synthase [Verrucomicrobiae bacterium]
MKPKTFMLIAGEASGDLLAAELVEALRSEMASSRLVPTSDSQPLHASLEPRFFGAGGPLLAKAGVSLVLDLTQHSVIGLSDVLKNYLEFRRLFFQLYALALDRQPDAIICVDFSGFNRRFAHAIKQHVRQRMDWFHDWNPKVIQYVSPQVWASREGRAHQIARDYDLLVTLFPFEKDWYAKRVPRLRVEFAGHPMLDRYAGLTTGTPALEGSKAPSSPMVVLLPGSRAAELARHLPVMLGALRRMLTAVPGLRSRMALPNETLARQAKAFDPPGELVVQAGGLPAALAGADLAIASTGTVTMECAYFGVPTVALYRTSWSTYQVAKRLVKVRHLAMPNLLAGEEVFPEFVQGAATAENLAEAALGLLKDGARRLTIKTRLAQIIGLLGGPGACRRAAKAILAAV